MLSWDRLARLVGYKVACSCATISRDLDGGPYIVWLAQKHRARGKKNQGSLVQQGKLSFRPRLRRGGNLGGVG